ncbi:MAG TPA: helix-turn-helix transcriptional regulator [Dermatophilaceae bacterium]|jgi:DNA-binding CsgD family transcriptional regulator
MILEDLREQPLFGVVIETLAACDDSRRPEEVLCECVATMLEGEMAMHVDLTTARVEVASWPPGANTADLYVTDSLVARTRGGVVCALPSRGGSMPGEACESHAAAALGVPLTSEARPRRILVVVRSCGFSEAQIHYLSAALPLLAALDRHLQHCRAPHSGRSSAQPLGTAARLPLTSREQEVLELLATGLLASSIASTLGVSTRTVHVHLAHIYRKLDTNDRLSAVNKARAIGLLPRYAAL